MVTITKEKVLEKLEGAKLDKSSGLDGLHPGVLKEIAEEIVETFVVIFQESLESGRVPEDWKIANVTPLFKKGVRQKMGYYRLISLTLVVDKILVFIVKDEISEYLEVHEFFEEVMSRLDKREPMDVLYLDFKKAFDKVPHRRLLSKIRAYGVRGK
eukprot:g21657.t1